MARWHYPTLTHQFTGQAVRLYQRPLDPEPVMAIHAPLCVAPRAVSGYCLRLTTGLPAESLTGGLLPGGTGSGLEHEDVFYVRYMDDVLVMSTHRWGLRRAIKRLNVILNALRLEKHPDKTFIGRIEKGFDF